MFYNTGSRNCRFRLFCIQSILMFLYALHKAAIGVFISRQRNILFTRENILHLTYIDFPQCCAVRNCNGRSNACRLARSNALRNQVQTVNRHTVRRHVPARRRDIVNSFLHNCA